MGGEIELARMVWLVVFAYRYLRLLLHRKVQTREIAGDSWPRQEESVIYDRAHLKLS
jgi:hypothetical protein